MTPAAHPSVLEAALALGSQVARAADETERERRLAPGLSDALSDAGLYRMCVPASMGGGEVAPQTLLAAVEALARGDAAAGWCVAVCATAGMLAAYLPEQTAREVFGDSRTVAGGVFAPTGRAQAEGDGLTVAGRWRFASNVTNCDWVMGGCVVFDEDRPRLAPGGSPDVQLVLFPASEIEVIDTWSVSGLRGTGSHDFAVDGLEVPAARAASLITDSPREPGALYAFPPFGLLAVSIAGVALGIARGALDDLGELAGVKTPAMSARRLAERSGTQAGMARAEAALRAARAGLFNALGEAWEAAQGDPSAAVSREVRAGLRLAATHAVQAGAEAVDAAYGLAGGSAIYETSPLQRRFRDVHAATQHMLVGPATWELTGRTLLGLEIDDSQL
jgi:alkylation response protein AidB-like acyl-CoA dehydrogenase